MVGFVILAAILAVLLVGLLCRRRWAWLMLVLLFGSAVVLDLLTRHGVLNVIRDVAGFALLMSPPMRRYINQTDVSDGPSRGRCCARSEHRRSQTAQKRGRIWYADLDLRDEYGLVSSTGAGCGDS